MQEKNGNALAFFQHIDRIKPVYDRIYAVVLFLCKIMLIADILITAFAVLGRHVPFIPDPAWTEEVVLTLMSYMTVLSAALAIRRQAHIRMTIFDDKLPRKALTILEIFSDIMIFILAMFMLVVGWNYCRTLGAVGTYISMPWLSRFWMYFPIPLAGLAMILFEVEMLLHHIRDLFIQDDLYDDVDQKSVLEEISVDEEEAKELRRLFAGDKREDESAEDEFADDEKGGQS